MWTQKRESPLYIVIDTYFNDINLLEIIIYIIKNCKLVFKTIIATKRDVIRSNANLRRKMLFFF